MAQQSETLANMTWFSPQPSKTTNVAGILIKGHGIKAVSLP